MSSYIVTPEFRLKAFQQPGCCIPRPTCFSRLWSEPQRRSALLPSPDQLWETRCSSPAQTARPHQVPLQKVLLFGTMLSECLSLTPSDTAVAAGAVRVVLITNRLTGAPGKVGGAVARPQGSTAGCALTSPVSGQETSLSGRFCFHQLTQRVNERSLQSALPTLCTSGTGCRQGMPAS